MKLLAKMVRLRTVVVFLSNTRRHAFLLLLLLAQIRQLLCLEKPTQQELDEFYEHHPWVRELEQLELEEQQQG